MDIPVVPDNCIFLLNNNLTTVEVIKNACIINGADVSAAAAGSSTSTHEVPLCRNILLVASDKTILLSVES
jgi:hypothetical protein